MKPGPSGSWFAIASLALLTLTLGSSACAKRCESAEGCMRTCPCTESESGLTVNCNMTFSCDTQAEVCDPMHAASCDEICQTYAAVGACGKQCSKDAECLLRCSCGDAGTILCEMAFACDTEVGVCETSHAQTSCATLCANCAVNP